MRPFPGTLLLLVSCAPPDDLPPTLFEDLDPPGIELPVPRSPPPAWGMSLEVGHLVAGEYAVLELNGAPPSTLIRIAYGRRLGEGPCVGQLDGACLDIEAPVRVAMFAAHRS